MEEFKSKSIKNIKDRFFLDISYEPKTDFKNLIFDLKEKEREKDNSKSNLNSIKNDKIDDIRKGKNTKLNTCDKSDKTNNLLNKKYESSIDFTSHNLKLTENEKIFKNSKGENFNTVNLNADKIDINYKTFNFTFNIPNSFLSEISKNSKFNREDEMLEKKILNNNFSKTIENDFGNKKNYNDKKDNQINKLKKELFDNKPILKKKKLETKISDLNNEKVINSNYKKTIKDNKKIELDIRKKVIHEVKREYKELINESIAIQKKMNEKNTNNNLILEKIEKYR